MARIEVYSISILLFRKAAKEMKRCDCRWQYQENCLPLHDCNCKMEIAHIGRSASKLFTLSYLVTLNGTAPYIFYFLHRQNNTTLSSLIFKSTPYIANRFTHYVYECIPYCRKILRFSLVKKEINLSAYQGQRLRPPHLANHSQSFYFRSFRRIFRRRISLFFSHLGKIYINDEPVEFSCLFNTTQAFFRFFFPENVFGCRPIV